MGIEPAATCPDNPEKTDSSLTPPNESAHICAQISGAEGLNVTQPDVKGGGYKNQKPLKTGAQVALWREETQNKMVEAVGIEPTS